MFFFVTQNVDWAILFCLLSAWFIPCSSTWKKGFLFCFFAGFGLSGMLCICFSKLNLLTKVEKQPAHKYPSIMLLFPWCFKIYFSFFTNRTLGNLYRSESRFFFFFWTVFLFLVTSFCLKGKSPSVKMMCFP